MFQVIFYLKINRLLYFQMYQEFMLYLCMNLPITTSLPIYAKLGICISAFKVGATLDKGIYSECNEAIEASLVYSI